VHAIVKIRTTTETNIRFMVLSPLNWVFGWGVIEIQQPTMIVFVISVVSYEAFVWRGSFWCVQLRSTVL